VRRLFALALAVTGCGDNHSAIGDDASNPDALFLVDAGSPTDGPPLAWIDFSASGCELLQDAPVDAGAPVLRCRGSAPLTVQFAAISPGPVQTWAWSFGDGADSADATPSHTYAAPRRYDVALSVAGPGGTATTVRDGFIEVIPAALGAACAADDQCATGQCLCAGGVAGEICPPGLATGMCTATCGARCAGGVCATLGNDEPWHGDWCLKPCGGDDDCSTGRVCEVVASAGGGWVEACVPTAALAGLGAACRDVGGLDDGLCASGDCLAVGVRGVCTTPCADAPCPSGARCAAFNNGVETCVIPCTAPGDTCHGDPWLACEAPGATGPWGIKELDGAPATVCAPRRCTKPEDCPGGICAAGHCGPMVP